MSSSPHRLAEVSLFAGLSVPMLDTIARTSLVRRYPAGQILCSEGDPAEALYIVEAGQLRVSRFGANGREAVLAVIEAPAALGELALLDGRPRDATVIAQSPVMARLVPRATFLDLLQAEPAVGAGLLRTLAGWVRLANGRQASILGLDVPGRLAQWLLIRAKNSGAPLYSGMVVDMGRSQGELAAELGTTRSTLNRALARFEHLELVELNADQVVLKDLTGLYDILL